ncbi:MAG: hypothetical protein LBD41_06690 [Clostridiales Family XIII bacterium]|jgi:uncharacterized protein YoxC|nr:hypothetical protein [Clostridiales Family XIII bacterium]
MKSCELAIIIALALIAISVTISTVFFIMILIKVKKIAAEFEKALHKINSELDVVSRVSSKIVSLTEKVSSPVVSILSVIFYALSSINKRKKQPGEENE